MPSYSISYARKDIMVKNFLEAESEIPISNMVELAVEYFQKTGTYMSLCNVSAEDEHPERKNKTIYISPKSDALQFITDNQRNGKSVKKLICEIIENGVEIDEYTEKITMKDYLVRVKELRDLSKRAPVQTNRIFQEQKAEKREQHNQDNRTIAESKQTEEAKEVIPEQAKEEKEQPKKRLTFADQFIKTF